MNIECPKVPDRMLQSCPLCKEPQGMMMRGLIRDIENGAISVSGNKGYSFCNCRNIFYTEWIDEYCYTQDITKDIHDINVNEFKKQLPMLKKLAPDAKNLWYVGDDDKLEETIKSEGYKINHKSDIIYMVDKFQTYKDPVKAMNALKGDALVYISTPDTFFINFEEGKGIEWDWFVQENHIMWNMENFVEFAEENGFNCLHKERGLNLHRQKDKEWYWKKDFKVYLEAK